MRKGTLAGVVFVVLLCARVGVAEEAAVKKPYVEVLKKIVAEGMQHQHAYRLLEQLTAIGPRLGGSQEAVEAAELTRRMMEEIGLDIVHLEPVSVRQWIRGPAEQARIVGGEELSVMALGGSVGTGKKGVEAEVVEVQSLEECDSLGEKAKGKIVFFNRPMNPTLLNTFRAYGGAADQRVHGASRAAAQGALAVIIRSMTMRADDVPHTGIMRYDPNHSKIPAAAVSIKGAELLSDRLKKGSAKVYLQMECEEREPVIRHNVVGDLRGRELPDEYVVVGGHLESWDAGTGAHDDGAGCMQALEAVRILKKLGVRPKRTIRAVMFMDEEMGGTGGRAYAQAEARKKEKHVAAFESDAGGFLPLGFGVRGSEEQVAAVAKFAYLMEHLGMFYIRAGFGGVDINPLWEQGVVTIGLQPSSQRYFDVHHSDNDVIDAVNPRELELGAVAMAVMVYVLAEEGAPEAPPQKK